MTSYRLATRFTATFVLMLGAWCGAALAEPATTAFDKAMTPILNDYLEIQRGLAADSTEGVRAAAKRIEHAAKNLDTTTLSDEHKQHYKNLPTDLRRAATALASSTDLQSARDAFKDLSKPMAMWGTMSRPDGIDVMFCGMAKANWLQEHGEVHNPYYGTSMSGCGEVQAGTALEASPMKDEQHGSHHMAR